MGNKRAPVKWTKEISQGRYIGPPVEEIDPLYVLEEWEIRATHLPPKWDAYYLDFYTGPESDYEEDLGFINSVHKQVPPQIAGLLAAFQSEINDATFILRTPDVKKFLDLFWNKKTGDLPFTVVLDSHEEHFVPVHYPWRTCIVAVDKPADLGRLLTRFWTPNRGPAIFLAKQRDAVKFFESSNLRATDAQLRRLIRTAQLALFSYGHGTKAVILTQRVGVSRKIAKTLEALWGRKRDRERILGPAVVSR